MTEASPNAALDRLHELITRLKLELLEGESGLFVQNSMSDLDVQASDGHSPASNAIYYMLTKKHPQNNLHWLFSDDYQVLIEGGPADYYIFYSNGEIRKQTLGRNISDGQKLMISIPAGSYKATQLWPDEDYALVASINTPAWNPARVNIGAGQPFIEEFSGKAEWATPEFLKELIGPNWKEE